MRKSLTKEKERIEEISVNLEKELDKYKELSNVPYPYQLWQRIPKCNLKLQELKPNYYYDTIKLIEEYYLTEEPLYKFMNMKEDHDSTASVKLRILNNLKDSTSVVALNEGNLHEIAGVLVMVEVPRNYFRRVMSREELVHGACHLKYVNLTSNLLSDVDLYTMFDCFSFLRIYTMCIKPSYRHIGLGVKLFETAVYVAQSLKIPVMMGIFTDSCLQVLARKIGMHEVKEIKYSEWKDSDDHQIFTNLRRDHTSCSIMAGRVPLPPPPPEPELAQPIWTKQGKKKQRRKKN